jgi:hypothetical protein
LKKLDYLSSSCQGRVLKSEDDGWLPSSCKTNYSYFKHMKTLVFYKGDATLVWTQVVFISSKVQFRKHADWLQHTLLHRQCSIFQLRTQTAHTSNSSRYLLQQITHRTLFWKKEALFLHCYNS